MEALTSSSEAVILEHLSPDFEMVRHHDLLRTRGNIAVTKTQVTACEDLPVSCPVNPSDGLEQHLKNTALFKQRFPKWTVEVSHARCTMTKGSNTAEVWLSCRGLHTPESQMFNRETVHVLYWRRSKSQGNWCCYRHQGIGGGGDFF